jgi:hypothetical protein
MLSVNWYSGRGQLGVFNWVVLIYMGKKIGGLWIYLNNVSVVLVVRLLVTFAFW